MFDGTVTTHATHSSLGPGLPANETITGLLSMGGLLGKGGAKGENAKIKEMIGSLDESFHFSRWA